jgi:hypothetical protein
MAKMARAKILIKTFMAGDGRTNRFPKGVKFFFLGCVCQCVCVLVVRQRLKGEVLALSQ